ncbi:TIM barrel protein [Pontiellaceae bacterium B12227]|nr:TIM barrel protein [Pontiellaceae bacterium B12227]
MKHFFLSFITLMMVSAVAAETTMETWPLGSFHFDFDRLGDTKAEQIDALQKLGYGGMVFNLSSQKQLIQFNEYLKVAAASDFEVYAGYVHLKLKKDNSKNYALVERALSRLKKADASLWLIVQIEDGLERKEMVEGINHIADLAAGAGIEFILYPHDRTAIESAEEALAVIEELDREDVYLSLHLCHEIRAGNHERLNEVAATVKPWLRLPSISGTDIEYEGAAKGDWSKNIQPLGDGDYDAAKLLTALKSIDYEGPVLLHTYGLQKVRQSHHADSIDVYREMLKKLND